MKNATIGLLLSGLVFPGAGHLFLKAYKKAMILISLTLFSFISIVVTILSQLDTALEKLQAEGGKIDLDSVTLTVNQAVSPADQRIFTIFYVILIGCWLVGVIDAYRVGKKKDSSATPAD